jgi:flagellar motor switch protein FliN/FliY
MNTMDLHTDMDLQDLLDSNAQAPRRYPAPALSPPEPERLSPFLHRIPVTLTLEAGSARITLQELADLGPDSVVPLDTMVGEPLTIKVNGSAIGKGEVVVCGESYGLKVLELHAELPALGH